MIASSMEQSVGSRMAVLVYHYLLERRMANVAEMFAEKCIYLKDIKRSPYHCLLYSTPLQSLCWFLTEHETLVFNMKGLIQMYYQVAPLPFEATTWEKVQFLVQYFYERATCNTVAERPKNTPGQMINCAVGTDNEDTYRLENNNNDPHQQESSMQQENHNDTTCTITLYKDAWQQTDPISSMGEQTTVLYLTNCSKEQIDKDTIMITMDDSELATDGVEHLIEDDEVAIGQHVEVTTLMVEPVQLPSESPPTASAVDENPAEMFANKENQEPFPVSTAINPESQTEQNTATEYVVSPSETMSPIMIAEASPVLENPSPPTKALTSVQKIPIDPEALEEWKRIRSINNRNFDDHIRQLNRQYEITASELRVEAKKSTTAKSKTTPVEQNIHKAALKPNPTLKDTKQSAQKRNATDELGMEKSEMPPAKRPAVAEATKRWAMIDSDSTDFASSTDEDEDVREMTRRIKQYRAQQKRCPSKEKKREEESTGQQSNVFTSPSTLKQCRVNLIVGQRSPGKSPVKRGLRNRTPSTSPVGTPVKLSKPGTDNTTLPSARRIGTARQQLLQSGKKAKEPTGHQKPLSTSVTAKQPPSAPVALSPKNRRPVRACTMNRKTIVASTPLKQTVPNVEIMAAALTTPEQSKESNLKPVTEPRSTTEPIPEAVDAGEAAIYAVLAQLHGDN